MSPQGTGAGGCLQQGRGCVAASDSRARYAEPVASPVLAGCLRLNRDLMRARRGALRSAGHALLPGATRASLGIPVPAPECGRGLFASLLALEGASSAVRKSSRRR